MVSRWLLLIIIFLACAENTFAQVEVRADASWKVSKAAGAQWMNHSYDDSAWSSSVFPSRGTCSYRYDPTHFTLPMWGPKPKEHETIFLRKKVLLTKPVAIAYLDAWFDDDGEVYVNGEQVIQDASKHLEKEKTRVDVTRRLNVGSNIIALKGIDVIGGCQWIQFKLEIEYEDGTHLEVPLYKQTAPAWNARIYDHAQIKAHLCGTTIGACGCALTSLAMILRYHGVDRLPSGEILQPDTLNEYMNQGAICTHGGCISQGYAYGAVRWNVTNQLTKRANDLYGSPKVQLMQSGPYSTQEVKAEITQGNPVILKSTNQSHWFVATGFTDSTIDINDPAFARLRLDDPAYGNTAAAMRRYQKVHSDFSLLEIFVKTPGNVLVTDAHGRRTGYDSATHQLLEEIPGSHYVFEEIPSLELLSTEGAMWLYITTPEEGTYKIETNGADEMTLYVSDRDAHEKKLHTTKSDMQVYFSPDNLEESIEVSELPNACVL